MNILIRKAEEKDVPSIYALIKELAHYEKAPGEVKVTEADLLADGFGPDPVYYCFVAEVEAKVVGIALYYIKYSTWKGKGVFLEDLIVTESFRRSNIGKRLFDEVVKVARELNARRLEWQVLDWNEPAINFYKKLNSQFSKEWINCRLTEKELAEYNFHLQ